MANKQVWLANSSTFTNISDGYTIVDINDSPVGQRHNSQVSGNNVRILNPYDVIFNVNSLSVAESNSIALQSIIDALPDSGGAIGIPHDLALTNIVFPKRTISGVSNQPINFKLYGTRPGVNIYGMSTGSLFTISAGDSGSVYTPIETVSQQIKDIHISCRGIGVDVTSAGEYFTANRVAIWSESLGWHFKHCNNMRLGNVSMIGYGQFKTPTCFIFDNCTGVYAKHLLARGSYTGVIVNNCENFYGAWDVEGNVVQQVIINGLKHARLGLYMEGGSGPRISITGGEDIYIVGDGLSGHEERAVDTNTKLLCPLLYQVQLSGLSSGNIGTPTASNISIPVTFSGSGGQWSYTTTAPMYASGDYVNVAPSISGYSTGNKVMDTRWQAKGSVASGDIVGTLKWSSAGNIWQTVEIRESDSFRDYTFERGIVPTGVANISYFGESGSTVDFKLTHIAEVSRLVDYCVPT